MLSVELVAGQVVVGVSLGGERESFSGRTSAYYPLNNGTWHNVTLVMDVRNQVRATRPCNSTYTKIKVWSDTSAWYSHMCLDQEHTQS